jgi:hypothetical protein
MRLTASQLRQIIQEELQEVIKETDQKKLTPQQEALYQRLIERYPHKDKRPIRSYVADGYGFADVVSHLHLNSR